MIEQRVQGGADETGLGARVCFGGGYALGDLDLAAIERLVRDARRGRRDRAQRSQADADRDRGGEREQDQPADRRQGDHGEQRRQLVLDLVAGETGDDVRPRSAACCHDHEVRAEVVERDGSRCARPLSAASIRESSALVSVCDTPLHCPFDVGEDDTARAVTWDSTTASRIPGTWGSVRRGRCRCVAYWLGERCSPIVATCRA